MAWIPAAVAAGGSIIGGMMSNEEHIGPGDYLPGKLGRDALIPISQGIMDLQTPEYFQGSTIAPMGDELNWNLNNAQGWGNYGGRGFQQMWDMYNPARQGLSAVGQGMDYLQGMNNRGPNMFEYDQNTYNDVMGNLAPGVQDMFDVNANQIQQGYDFNTLPGLNMSAGLAGGYGGTKAQQQSALGQAMTAGNIRDMGAGLWQNASNAANQAGYGAGMANLNTANAFDQNMMSNYGRFGAMGGNMLNRAYDMGQNNLQTSTGAGSMLQDYDQLVRDDEVARFNFEQQAPWLDTANRLGLIQDTAIGIGGQGNTGMSGWEGALQGANAGLGLYNAGQNAGWWGGNSGGNSDVIDSIINGTSGIQW